MAPTVPLTPLRIAQETLLLTLGDLLSDSTSDIENDLDVLLHWLEPFYPTATPLAEPLARTRAAARNCLKDPASQLEFVRLWVNSIRRRFHAEFVPVVASGDLRTVLAHVAAVSKYYARQSAYLNLTRAAADLFRRSINALFVRHLRQLRLLTQLYTYLVENPGDDFLLAAFNIGMGELVQATMTEITVKRIHMFVTKIAAGTWNVPVVDRVREWVRVDIYPAFIQGCFSSEDASSGDLVLIAHDWLIRLRTSEIYEIVATYPHSEVALTELHVCLVYGADAAAQTRQRAQLVDSFVTRCQQRLLHLGANTEDVILAYSQTIKAFLLVDPTGVLLDKVARPIRRYLKTRTDLVDQLVRGMLDLSSDNRLVELARELHKNKKPAVAPVDDLTDVTWVPDPIDALPDFKKGKVLDVVEALVSILPLASVFVEEFTRLFGARLLQWTHYSPRDVMHDVELLKTRFGATEFATLDVMVKDIHDSNTINTAICDNSLVLTVLSRMYWPTVCDNLSDNDYFSVPVQDQFDAFQDRYKQMKHGRSLKLIPSLGSVKLELTMRSGPREFTVTPAQASVIDVFNDERDALSVQTVMMVTAMPEYVVTQALRFWVSQGILREINGKYIVDE